MHQPINPKQLDSPSICACTKILRRLRVCASLNCNSFRWLIKINISNKDCPFIYRVLDLKRILLEWFMRDYPRAVDCSLTTLQYRMVGLNISLRLQALQANGEPLVPGLSRIQPLL